MDSARKSFKKCRSRDEARPRHGHAVLWLALAALSLGAGCVAVPVGRTEMFLHSSERLETDSVPCRVTAENPRVVLLQEGESVEVSLTADVVKEHARRRFVKETTVRRQRRLAFGLFPGAAEIVWMPEEALASTMTVGRSQYDTSPRYCGYYHDETPGLVGFGLDELGHAILGLGFRTIYDTVESLLFAPFETWKCERHDFHDRDCWRRGVARSGKSGRKVADASMSPRLRALAELPEELRSEIGIRTCFDVRSTSALAEGEHLGLAGFHKYLAVFVDLAEREAGEAEVERRTEKAEMEGPYEVELSIPGAGHSERRVVGRGETKVRFELPRAVHETAIEARVSMQECGAAGRGTAPELTRQALRGLAGQGSRFDVNLAGGARGGADWEILQIRPSGDGRYVVRVRLKHPSGQDTAVREIEEEVRRRIREDYANRHPSACVDEVRDWVRWKTADGEPGILVFAGWAFSAVPLGQGGTGTPKRGAARCACGSQGMSRKSGPGSGFGTTSPPSWRKRASCWKSAAGRRRSVVRVSCAFPRRLKTACSPWSSKPLNRDT